MHSRLIGWTATAPTAAGAAAAAMVGDSLVIENNIGTKGPLILALWGMQQATGFQQVAFPSGHDTTRGDRYGMRIADTSLRLPAGCGLAITAQETMTITISGSAVAGDIEIGHALIHYPNLPGVESRAINWSELQDRIEKQSTIFFSVTALAAGGYQGSELITSDSDLLMANRDYAILGFETNTNTAASVWILGPDTGNVKVGCPGTTATMPFTKDWFCGLSKAFGDTKEIPVISSGNKANTFVGISCDENTPTVVVTMFVALLSKK